MMGITSTSKAAPRTSLARRLGAGSVLALALVTVGSSPALAGTNHPAKASHHSVRTHVGVHLGPAFSATRVAGRTIVLS